MYIILGKNGYIAESMIKELTLRKLHFIALSRSDLDYTNFKTFSDFYNINYNSTSTPTKNSVIINCAGYVGKPNVDACELNKSDTIMGNVIFPTNLANHCSVNSSTLVQISSGCVYNGYDKHFSEDDEPNFSFQNGSFYSGSKALCERMILKHNPLSYIFRLRIPFDQFKSRRNYLTKLMSYDKLLNMENSLTHRGDFSKYVIDLLEKKAPHGIYNIANKGSVTTKDVTELIKKYHLSNNDFIFFDDLSSFCRETVAPRSNCVLDTTKIEQYIKIRSVTEALEEAIINYK
tara:strand:- start:300 stop:1169 length:870 start_codon:yes stop_codon:yes gene_type:complete